MSQRVSSEEFADIIYDEIIDNNPVYEALKQPTKDSGLLRDEKGNIYFKEEDGHIEVAEKKLEWECFYLWTFLTAYHLQKKFIYLGNEKIKQILDIIHQRIYSPRQKPSLSIEDLTTVRNMLAIRYNQYYRAMKDDWEVMEKRDATCLLFYSSTLVFTENLVNRKIDDFKEFRVFRIFFGMYLAKICKLLLDIFEKTKTNYEIIF